MSLHIQQIDTRQPAATAAIAELRAKLAPSGHVVSEAGRRKTIEVFGEPLAPAQVVERICADVRANGLEAVLRYTAKLDGAQLSAETLRVPVSDLAAAHAKSDRDFLETIRRIRDNILRFQTAILPSFRFFEFLKFPLTPLFPPLTAIFPRSPPYFLRSQDFALQKQIISHNSSCIEQMINMKYRMQEANENSCKRNPKRVRI
jgi:hypothetical protein